MFCPAGQTYEVGDYVEVMWRNERIRVRVESVEAKSGYVTMYVVRKL